MLEREGLARLAVLVGTFTACGAGAPAADPTAPSGWQLFEARETVSLYRPVDGDGRVEVRLYAVDASTETLQVWFERRMRTPPPDVEVTAVGPARTTPHGYLAALAEGRRIASGSPATAAVMACERADGGKHYAELVVPPDPALARPSVAKVAEIIVLACSAATVATTATPTSTAAAY